MRGPDQIRTKVNQNDLDGFDSTDVRTEPKINRSNRTNKTNLARSGLILESLYRDNVRIPFLKLQERSIKTYTMIVRELFQCCEITRLVHFSSHSIALKMKITRLVQKIIRLVYFRTISRSKSSKSYQ